MNTLRRLSASKPKATRHTASLSRAGGSIGLSLSDDNCVTDVLEGSAASSADIQIGDRVVGFCGQPLERKLVSLLGEYTGSEVELEIERGGMSERRGSRSSSGSTPRLSLGRRSRSSSEVPPTMLSGLARSGSFAAAGESIVTVLMGRSSTSEPWGLEVDEENNVTAVMFDSVATRAGLQVGDVVTKVDGRDLGEASIVGDPSLDSLFMTAAAVTLTVRRGVAFEREISMTQRRMSTDL